jgi:predicted ATP-dependent endonuclease of OLD family
MQIKGFQVLKYRNIIDSGWIEVKDIVALVGQNECGKSNLLQALFKLLPYDDTKYDLTRDWPIDEWGKQDNDQVVCRAKFELCKEEINDLFNIAKNNNTQEEKVELKTNSSLPASLELIIERKYDNQYNVRFPEGINNELDESKANNWSLKHLPKCVYMNDYMIFRGHAELIELTQRLEQRGFEKLEEDDKTILIILDLAQLNIKEIIKQESSKEGRTLRGFDTNAASSYLSKQFKHTWKQKNIKFNVRVDGPSLDLLVEDEGLGSFVPLEARSRGFQWFFSFVWRFTHASKGEFKDCILLLDEPGIHLHHAGHTDLLNFFEKLSETNTIIYTTHLATLLDPGYPERIRILEIHEHHATVSNSMISSQKEPMMVIEQILGLSGAMGGLLGYRQNLVVEGEDDVVILEKFSGLFQHSKEEGLSDRIFLIPAKGTSKTPMYAGFLVGNKFDAGVLLDSDSEGESAKKKIKELYLDSLSDENETKFRILMLGEIAGSKKNSFSIEDVFPIDFYLDCVNKAYRTNIKEDELPKDGSAQVCKRVEAVLQHLGHNGKIDKERVLVQMLKKFDDLKKISDLPAETVSVAKKIINKINKTFENKTTTLP